MSSFDGDDFDSMSQEDYDEYLRQQYGDKTIDEHHKRFLNDKAETEDGYEGVF